MYMVFSGKIYTDVNQNTIAKKIFCDLVELDQKGFNTWATDASKLVNDLRLDVTNDKNSFSMNCKRAIQNKFKTTWITHLQNTGLYPRLRTYRTIKYEYIIEPYLYLVKRHDIVKLSRNFVAAPTYWIKKEVDKPTPKHLSLIENVIVVMS